jgi:hypothetical protein
VLAAEVRSVTGLHALIELEDHRLVLARDGVFARDGEAGWLGKGRGTNRLLTCMAMSVKSVEFR